MGNETSKANDMDDVLARYRAYQARATELHALNKARLLPALAETGIIRVVVRFDGYGDSGAIEQVEAVSADGPIDIPRDRHRIAPNPLRV